jgi:hypothetical protein
MSARIEARAEAAVAEAVERLAARLGEAVPGAEVTVEPGQVVLSGRGLARRMLAEPGLRWPGGLLR